MLSEKTTYRLLGDPRYYQIAVLTTLLLYGLHALQLEIRWGASIVGVVSALAVQYLCTRIWRLPHFDAKSALISGLSLALLLRTDTLVLIVAAAMLAIGSKFLLRYRGKHLFNPTNFAIAALLLCTDRVWISPGQWGQTALLVLMLACLGIVVLTRARRTDITFGFLGFYAALLCARAVYLGDPLALPWHDLHSGALLIFAFFMISDPKSTPNSRAGRILFAALVALLSAFFRFGLYEPDALMYGLALCAPIVPFLDHLLPGKAYLWRAPTGGGSGQSRCEARRPTVLSIH